jgi:hypothetical protein
MAAVALALAVPVAAHADTADEPAAEADTAGSPRAAVGLSTGWIRRNDYGDRTRGALAVEFVGLGYVATQRDRVFLRPGLRVGYVGLAPAEMPSALRFVERDATLAAELGALYDGVIIPAVSLGAGVSVRQLALDVGPPISTDETPLRRWEYLPMAYAQIASGVPIAGGRFLIEPFMRFELMAGDNRARWRTGLDFTFELR